MTPRLITIPFSHYCEKARWALERGGLAYVEDGHLPLFHYLPVRRAGARRTVPVLVDGADVIADSTDIVAWADARGAELIPAGDVGRAAEAVEDELDRELGPATRRWAYYQLLPRRELDREVTRGVPRWEAVAFRAARPVAVGVLRRGLRIDAAGAERSRLKIEAAFAFVAELLADGRRYLVGDRFTVADLTFAALAAPVLMPPEHPFGFSLEVFPAGAAEQIRAWRATPAGAHGLRMYVEHRRRGV